MATGGLDLVDDSSDPDASLPEAESPEVLFSDVSLPFGRDCCRRRDPSNDCVEEAAWEWKLELTNRTGDRLSRCDRFVEADAEREGLEGVLFAAPPLDSRR
jgi:hypothetical protein